MRSCRLRLGLGGQRRELRLVGWPERRNRSSRLGGSPAGDDPAETAREAVLRLQDAAVLLCERVRKRGPGDEAALDDDLAQATAGLRLLLEDLRKLLLGEEAGSNQDPAELRCWKVGRVHDFNIGLAPRFVRGVCSVRADGQTRPVIGEEARRLSTWGDRHRRLVARVVLAMTLTLLVDVISAVLVWYFEHGIKGGDINGFGDAIFFSTVQLLTVSSQIKNPLTVGGRIVDVFLEIWALFVVTSIAGSFAAFFGSADA
jgi:hypothetical protein